jgi:hypothetical protein
MKRNFISIIFLVVLNCNICYSQTNFETTFEQQMVEYELDVVRTYNELQNFLLNGNPNTIEQTAFENLLSIYVDRILEIYNTIQRVTGSTLETYRGITARVLIFRALTYLERSKESNDYYQKATDDYKKALELYQKSKSIPIMNERLPYEVWIDKKMYTTLADLLDDKSKGFALLRSLRSR